MQVRDRLELAAAKLARAKTGPRLVKISWRSFKSCLIFKSKMKIHLITAARPNFMKIAPLYHALKSEEWAEPVIVHTGQHYDLNMSDVFFTDLGLPDPGIHLGVGSGSHAEQTGRVMMAYEKVLLENEPDLVVVVGDVNSTVACTLAAVKLPAHSSKQNHKPGKPGYC